MMNKRPEKITATLLPMGNPTDTMNVDEEIAYTIAEERQKEVLALKTE